MYKNILYLEMH